MDTSEYLVIILAAISFLFFTDAGKNFALKLKSMLPFGKNSLNAQNSVASENTLLKRAELWEQLNELVDDPIAKKLLNDLWPTLNKKPKGEGV